MRLFAFATFLTSLLSLIRAAVIEGDIDFPEGATSHDLVLTTIELIQVSSSKTDGLLRKQAFINQDGHFQFNNIPTGSYLLSVSSIKYNLQPFKLRIDVDAEDNILARIVQGAQSFESVSIEVPHPIKFIVNPTRPTRNYIKKRGSSILESGPLATILGNPLYLAGVLIAIGIGLAPYILEKVDPEIAKIVQEQKAERSGKNTKASIEAVQELHESAKTLEKIIPKSDGNEVSGTTSNDTTTVGKRNKSRSKKS